MPVNRSSASNSPWTTRCKDKRTSSATARTDRAIYNLRGAGPAPTMVMHSTRPGLRRYPKVLHHADSVGFPECTSRNGRSGSARTVRADPALEVAEAAPPPGEERGALQIHVERPAARVSRRHAACWATGHDCMRHKCAEILSLNHRCLDYCSSIVSPGISQFRLNRICPNTTADNLTRHIGAPNQLHNWDRCNPRISALHEAIRFLGIAGLGLNLSRLQCFDVWSSSPFP